MQHPGTVWTEPDASKIEVDPSIGTRWREPIKNEAKAKVGDEFIFFDSRNLHGGVHKITLRGGTQSHMEKFGTKLIESRTV